MVPDRLVIIDARMIGYTGIGRYVADLLRYGSNQKTNYSFEIAVLTKPNSHDINSFKIHGLIATSRIFSIREQLEIPRLIAKAKAKLVHFPQFNVALLTHSPFIVTIHDCAFDKIPEERPSSLAYAYYKVMMAFALKKAKKIIAVSHATKSDLVNIYNVPENKVIVIHLGIDVDYFKTTEISKTTWSRIKGKFNLDAPYILYVGLIRPRKNIGKLLIAVQKLCSRFDRPFRLVMAGPLDNRFINVADTAKSLGIEDIVVQTGYLSDTELLALYKHSSMLILPSLLEGFGLPLLEGMASGIPVIASDIQAHREVVNDAAILVSPNDADAISEAMYRVFTDAALAACIINKGYERVRMFSWEVCAKKTFELYEELLNL